MQDSLDLQQNLALIGFGEAGKAFVSGWQSSCIRAYDIKTDSSDGNIVSLKNQDYVEAGITGCDNSCAAVTNATMIFSLVTAEQSLEAARSAALDIGNNSWFFDCNSCAPDTKRQASAIITKAGGRYVDVAVMGPVGPVLNKIPLLISGENAIEALPLLKSLGHNTNLLPGDVGRASSVKMMRSIMMKGLEALALECVLSARIAGVEAEVLQSLEVTYPGFNWVDRSAHMLERVMTHGIRRAEEMREVAKTVNDLDLSNDMAKAITKWHQRIGDMGLEAVKGAGYQNHADQIIENLGKGDANKGA